MDAFLNFLIPLLGSLSGVPYVGKALQFLVLFATLLGGASGLVSSLVLLWQAFVKIFQALSLFPGLSFFAKTAAWFQAEDAKVEDFANNKILPILNRLSAIPLPQKPAAPSAGIAQSSSVAGK